MPSSGTSLALSKYTVLLSPTAQTVVDKFSKELTQGRQQCYTMVVGCNVYRSLLVQRDDRAFSPLQWEHPGIG